MAQTTDEPTRGATSDRVERSFRKLKAGSALAKRAGQSAFFARAKEKARRARIGGTDFYVLEGDLLLDEVQLAEYALGEPAGLDVTALAELAPDDQPAK